MSDAVVWIVLILIDLAYELWGVHDDAKGKMGGPADPHPLTYWVRTLMTSFWPAKLILMVFWVWLGFHFWVQS